MNSQSPEDVTDLLRRWNEDDERALDQLIPLVYAKPQQLARRCLRGERPDHSVHTGTLVHEAYLRLIDCDRLPWQDRRHFFAVAARVMRRVLVEEARSRIEPAPATPNCAARLKACSAMKLIQGRFCDIRQRTLAGKFRRTPCAGAR